MAAMVFSAMALAQAVDEFKVYLGDAQGKPFTGPVPEGTTVYVVVQGTGRYCGMDKFPADILIFDFKTGAYIMVMDDPTTPEFEGAWFRELGGAGTGLFFWVAGENSTTKVGVQLGSRLTFGGLGNVITGYLSSYLWLGRVAGLHPLDGPHPGGSPGVWDLQRRGPRHSLASVLERGRLRVPRRQHRRL
jgi:hypothetical protein